MKKKIRVLLKIYVFGFSFSVFGQSTDSLINILYPLEIPMSISGNFGELRTNALHAGIDFRTQSKTGFNVYAIDNGYVSRIKIEPGGYGKAIYINHANGLTSVYAHLDGLGAAIDNYTKKEQYRLLQFQVDLFPPKDSIPVRRGDIIGFSGNSGSSTGPHLHFEVREEKDQIPLNIIRNYNFYVNDNDPPVIKSLWVYPFGDSSHVNLNDTMSYTYNLKPQDTIVNLFENLNVWGKIGFGIEVYDPVKPNTNKTGIYSIELYADSNLIFNQVMDKFSFDQVRYVNSLIDYKQFAINYTRINRLYVQPNNKLNIYPTLINNGITDISDTLAHKITIVAKDANLNARSIVLYIKGKYKTVSFEKKQNKGNKIIPCQSEQLFEDKNFRVLFSQNSLYEDLDFQFYVSPHKEGYFSELYQVHNKYTPIHQAVKLQIKPTNLPDSLKPKALLANIENNKIIWCGGSFKWKYVEANIRSFGQYTIIVDTLAPSIVPLKQVKKSIDFTREDLISFEITDDLSGISSYQGFIDGSWALFEFDAKNNFLYYKFDQSRITFGSTHKIDLFVTDARGNLAEYHSEFIK